MDFENPGCSKIEVMGSRLKPSHKRTFVRRSTNDNAAAMEWIAPSLSE